MRASRIATAAILPLVLLAGGSLACARTKYQPKSFTGGYSETRLGEDRFRVSFHGNAYVSRDFVLNGLLYRCAELTRIHGYEHFVIVDAADDSRAGTYQAPGTYSGSSTNFGTTTTHQGVYRPGTTVHYTKHGASATIVLRRGVKNPNDPNAYDAAEVLRYVNPHGG